MLIRGLFVLLSEPRDESSLPRGNVTRGSNLPTTRKRSRVHLISTPLLSFVALDGKVGEFPTTEALGTLGIDGWESACSLPKTAGAGFPKTSLFHPPYLI